MPPSGETSPSTIRSGAAAGVTVVQAATHASGLPRGVTRRRSGSWQSPYERVGVETLCADAREVATLGPATFSYSNLGASLAGWATARSIGATYARLMRTRLFEPLGMGNSGAQTAGPLAPRGHSRDGRRVPQLVADGYAPMGGLVSTTADLGTVASHPGGTPGYAAYLAVDPGRGRGVAVLADQAGAGVEHLGKTILEALP